MAKHPSFPLCWRCSIFLLCLILITIAAVVFAKRVVRAAQARFPVYLTIPAKLNEYLELEHVHRLRLEAADNVEELDYSMLSESERLRVVSQLNIVCDWILKSIIDSTGSIKLPRFEPYKQIKVSVFMPTSGAAKGRDGRPEELVLIAGDKASIASLSEDWTLPKNISMAGNAWRKFTPQLGGPINLDGSVNRRWHIHEPPWNDHKTEVTLCMPLLEIGPRNRFLGVLSISCSRRDILPLDENEVFNVSVCFTVAAKHCTDCIIHALKRVDSGITPEARKPNGTQDPQSKEG